MRYARKLINTEALVSNYSSLKKICSNSQLLAVVKCNAYGHGIAKIHQSLSTADGFAVATIHEAIELREIGCTHKIVILQGIYRTDELEIAIAKDLSLVVHTQEQLVCIEQYNAPVLPDLWIKIDTGMRRIGFSLDAADKVISRIKSLNGVVNPPVLMSHFCCANDDSSLITEKQWTAFQKIYAQYALPGSIANSAACLSDAKFHLQWVRVGIALYGSPPYLATEHQFHFKPVMQLIAPIISIKQCRTGDSIGYGHRYTCDRDRTIGIVAIGYGDGYPRQAQNGTPVWVAGHRQSILGEVSMDMIAISLDDVSVAIGDMVELWGENIPVSEIAQHCGTISYQLLAGVSNVGT